MPLTEYKPGAAFHGVIGRTTAESSPVQPQPVRAVPGAPNVMFIVLDDTGYGQLGCYGSPIATLHLDALAASGLLYHNMHTTALCSPSRSCIITGRNHHTNAAAAINEIARIIQKSLVGIPPTRVCAGQGTVGDLNSGVLNNPQPLAIPATTATFCSRTDSCPRCCCSTATART